jgi:hypothetical protein
MTYVLAGFIFILLADRFVAQRVWDRERAELIQRIQAPERAVVAHDRGPDEEPPRRFKPVSLDDDDAMARAHGEEVEVDDDGS